MTHTIDEVLDHINASIRCVAEWWREEAPVLTLDDFRRDGDDFRAEKGDVIITTDGRVIYCVHWGMTMDECAVRGLQDALDAALPPRH